MYQQQQQHQEMSKAEEMGHNSTSSLQAKRKDVQQDIEAFKDRHKWILL